MTTLQRLAAEAYEHFETFTRGSDDDRTFWRTKDSSPEWIRDLCLAAHDNGNIWPDDWRYEFIVDALTLLEENEDPDDISIEADIYTSHLTAWLASRVDRFCYCDDAIQEFGPPQGDTATISLLTQGQYLERREVFDSVRFSLELRASELEEEAEDVQT